MLELCDRKYTFGEAVGVAEDLHSVERLHLQRQALVNEGGERQLVSRQLLLLGFRRRARCVLLAIYVIGQRRSLRHRTQDPGEIHQMVY